MTWLVLLLLADLKVRAPYQLGPCVSTKTAEDRARVEAAGVTRLCDDAALGSREPLPTPGITARPGLASPTRAPWIVANGWRFMRQPAAKFVYDVPAGKAALAAAEAFAYGADAVVKIEPGDAPLLAKMLAFLERVPAVDLPAIADLAVVDDGSEVTGEVLNLLARRNLLFDVVKAPESRFGINIAIGSPQYSREDAADPSAFALKVRRQLTDERRSLRVFGSEVVICRLTGTAERARLHLINYGGREIEGLRVRVRGAYPGGEGHSLEAGRFALADHATADGATEFSLPRLVTYAVVDLTNQR
jgi:hypothetical protein